MLKKLLKILGWLLGIISLVVFLAILLFREADIPVQVLKDKYATPPSAYIDIQGMNVHYRDEGPRDSIPLVLLHGTSSSLFTWNDCTDAWTINHRVVRMDLPGFALTGPRPDGDYNIQAYVSFLHAFLRTLQIDSCYMAGNSLGGLIAYSYAAQYPQEIKKLILVDPAGYPIGKSKGSLAFTLARIPVLKNLLKIVTPTSIIRKSIEDVYGDPKLVGDSLVQLYKDMACREGNRDALVKRLNLPQSEDTTRLLLLPMPALIVWGKEDGLIPVENAYKFQRDIPNNSLVVLPGIGHVPMEESPEQMIALVHEFLKRE